MVSDSYEKKALLMEEDDDNDDSLIAPTRGKVNTKQHADNKINQIKNQVEGVIDDMKINIEKVVERGQSLNELNDRSEQLSASGDIFSKRARNVRKTMLLRTCRARLYLSLTLGFIFFLVLFFLYRMFSKS